MGGSIKRKVILQGNSTLSISLPWKWSRKYAIKKGDELDVTEDSSRLIISADEETELSYELVQDISGLAPRLADRLLARSYQKGYDKLILTHNDVKVLGVLQSKVHELIGFEIVEQNERLCIIQAITRKIDMDFESSLRKLFLNLKRMLIELHEAYEKKDKKGLSNLEHMDFAINRLAYFLLRQLTKEHYIGAQASHKGHVLYYLIESMEDLGDALKRMAHLLAEKQGTKSISSLLAKLIEQFDVSYSYYYSPSIEKANEAFKHNQQIREDIFDVMGESLSKKEIVALYYLKETTHIIYHLTTMRLDHLNSQSDGKSERS